MNIEEIEEFVQNIINDAKMEDSVIVSPYKIYTFEYNPAMGSIKNKIKNDFNGGTSIIGNDLHTYILFSETTPTDNLDDYTLVFDIDAVSETTE